MDVTSATNHAHIGRVSAYPTFPCGNKGRSAAAAATSPVVTVASFSISFPFDFVARRRMWRPSPELVRLRRKSSPRIRPVPRDVERIALRLGGSRVPLRLYWTDLDERLSDKAFEPTWAICDAERLDSVAIAMPLHFCLVRLARMLRHAILAGCDSATAVRSRDPKGFWRVDKDKDPELRHTVLTLVAFADLEDKIRAVRRRPRERH